MFFTNYFNAWRVKMKTKQSGASFCFILKQKVLILYLSMLQKLPPSADFYNIGLLK